MQTLDVLKVEIYIEDHFVLLSHTRAISSYTGVQFQCKPL
jgi:hypothetical protein